MWLCLCRQIITNAERENATYIEGSLIDRLAPGGILRQVSQLSEQSP